MSSKDIKAILISYGINEVSKVDKLSDGIENANYHIKSSKGDFVVRFYNQSHSIKGDRSLESIEEELSFVVACKGAVPVAAPIENIQGDYVTKSSGKEYCAVFEFVEGASPTVLNSDVVKKYASVLSQIYEVSLHFNVQNKELKHDIVSRALTLAESYKSDYAGVDKLITELKNQTKSSMPKLEMLPTGIIHGDIKLTNTLFDEGKITALLDFDDYRYSYLLEDTVMTIMHNIHEPKCNVLRAGLLDDLIGSITHPNLLRDIHDSLRTLIQARLLYDICKFDQKDADVLSKIINDPYVMDFLRI